MSVYSRITISPIPFLALATHKLNDVTHICYVEAIAAVRHVLRKQREQKRKEEKKNEINEHICISPSLSCAVHSKKIIYYGIGYA